MALSATGSGASRSVVYRLIADATGVLAGTRQASASMKKLGDDVTAVSKEGEKTRRGFDQMGRTAGRAGLIAAVGLGAMVLKAANFEQAMSHVAAATRETEDNMRLLRQAALDAGASTIFTAGEAAEAIENLAKAGVSTADILSGGLKGSLDLAAAGMLPVADAAEDIATALTQFKLPGEQATHVADLLAAGAGKAQGEVSDLANALKFAGVPAANLGVSIEETTGAIALFAKSGIIGEQAGTSLRGMLSSLTSPSKIAKKQLDDLGISMFNNKGKFVGLAGVADELKSKMKTLTDEERANALGKIFGNEQLQAANVLYREGGDAVREWTSKVDDAGFAADTAATKTDNLKGDIERLGGALDTFLIKGGTGSQGFLRGATKGITGVIDAANKLPPSLSGVLTGMLAITAVTGGGLWLGTKVIRGIADTREALANMGDAGVKASRGMKLVSGAAAGFTVLLIAAEAVKALQAATAESLPGLNTMQRRLIAISNSGAIADLGGQFDDLGHSIDQINSSEFHPIVGPRNIDVSQTLIKPFSLFGIEDSGLTEAKAEIDAIDQALAGLVSSGKPDIAAQAFTNIAQASGLTSEQLTELRNNMPAYQDALDGLENSATLAADAHIGMGKKVRIAGQAVHFTADQIKDAQDTYAKAREDAQGVAAGFFDISKKVDKAKLSLHDWISTLAKQAEALENFTANAKKATDRGLSGGLIDELEKLGPVGALRLKQLANASDKEIDRANKAYKRGQRAIEDYIDATTDVPDELRTDVVVLDDEAKRKERALRQKFVTFPKTVSTGIKFDTHAADVGLNHIEARLARIRLLAIITPRIKHTEGRLGGVTVATGGHIRGPGSGTSDSIPAYLSNGEYVIKAAAVARYGVAMFDRLNAMHFAQGGHVGGGSSTSVDWDMVGRIVASYSRGDTVNVIAQDMRDVDRQLAERRTRTSSDGVGHR